MSSLLIAPEVFATEGGIARIMRSYLLALAELAPPAGLIVLNDNKTAVSRMPRYLQAQRLTPLVMAGRSKLRFLGACLRHAHKGDHVLCGHLHLAPLLRLIKLWRPGFRYQLIAHGIEVWRPYTWLERQALLHATRILCVSAFTRGEILRRLPALEVERLVVLPNTLDPDFASPSIAQPARTITDDVRILSVGRMAGHDAEKGFDSLILAMPRIREVHPRATLRIVGTGEDLPRLQQLAATQGTADAIRFLGHISDDELRHEYAQCDVFALPSRKEGFGLVYLEAMSHGKPCLGANAGGAPEVIKVDVGALVEYGDQVQIAAAIDDLVRHPRDRTRIISHAATFAFPAFKKRLSALLAA